MIFFLLLLLPFESNWKGFSRAIIRFIDIFIIKCKADEDKDVNLLWTEQVWYCRFLMRNQHLTSFHINSNELEIRKQNKFKRKTLLIRFLHRRPDPFRIESIGFLDPIFISMRKNYLEFWFRGGIIIFSSKARFRWNKRMRREKLFYFLYQNDEKQMRW